jgi:hypothetical protein
MSERIDLNMGAESAIQDVEAIAHLLSQAACTGETPEHVGRIGVLIFNRLEPIKQFFDYYAYGEKPDEST